MHYLISGHAYSYHAQFKQEMEYPWMAVVQLQDNIGTRQYNLAKGIISFPAPTLLRVPRVITRSGNEIEQSFEYCTLALKKKFQPVFHCAKAM